MEWSKIEITSNRLLLTPFSAHDADEAYCCITPTLTRFMAWDPPATRGEFDQVWQSWLLAIQNGLELTFAIRALSSKHFLGVAALHHAQTPTPELGIWIREDCHGHGYGQEAVTALATWATAFFKPTSFIYPVAEENHASRRIAEHLGGVVFDRKVERKYTSVIYRIPPT
uniref:Acetyltransferase n=1 Tax=Nitratidesulfovibrio vulgaris (strain DSM 19637 / Miyazaki F) TaxID=883 RepID=B8DIT2_NITV9